MRIDFQIDLCAVDTPFSQNAYGRLALKENAKHLVWILLQCYKGGPQCGVPPTGCLNRAGPLLRDSSLSA